MSCARLLLAALLGAVLATGASAQDAPEEAPRSLRRLSDGGWKVGDTITQAGNASYEHTGASVARPDDPAEGVVRADSWRASWAAVIRRDAVSAAGRPEVSTVSFAVALLIMPGPEAVDFGGTSIRIAADEWAPVPGGEPLDDAARGWIDDWFVPYLVASDTRDFPAALSPETSVSPGATWSVQDTPLAQWARDAGLLTDEATRGRAEVTLMSIAGPAERAQVRLILDLPIKGDAYEKGSKTSITRTLKVKRSGRNRVTLDECGMRRTYTLQGKGADRSGVTKFFQTIATKPSETLPSAPALAWPANDWDGALARAKASGKPLLIRFTAAGSTNAIALAEVMDADPAIQKELARFERAEICVLDAKLGDLAVTQRSRMDREFRTTEVPLLVIVNAEGKELARSRYTASPEEHLTFLRGVK